MSYSKAHDYHVIINGYSTLDLLYVETANGRVVMEICEECEYTEIVCLHEMNSWNAEGTELTCDLCGEDGT